MSVLFQPTRSLFRGEMVTVTLTDSIRSVTGAALTNGYFMQLSVASGPGTGQFVQDQTLAMRDPGEGRIGMYGVYAGDFDRDGSPDLTSIHEISHDIRLLKNSGCGQFGPRTIIADPGQWPSANEGADFNRDNWLDLVTGNQNSGAVSVYLNDGTGNLSTPTVYSTSGYVHGVATADFNGDGYWDLAAPNGNDVRILLNQGDGTFAPAASYDAGGNGEDNVMVTDANEDGIADLIIGMRWSGLMGVLLGTGNGAFTLGQTRSTGGQPFSQSIGDCNADGHADVAFGNRGSNTFGLLFGDGSGGFSTATTYSVGGAPAAIDLGDLDGDGDLDSVSSNFSSGNYTIWWNRGDGIYLGPTTLAGIQAGSCSTLVDYNRDGVLDIITSDEVADLAVLYRQVLPAELGSWSGLQQRSCAATLRIDGRADLAGFAGTQPAAVKLGALMEIEFSGPDNGTAVLAFGAAQQQGIQISNLGLMNLDQSQPTAARLALLDADGEHRLLLRVPAWLSAGVVMSIQGATLIPVPQGSLSNPQTVITTM